MREAAAIIADLDPANAVLCGGRWGSSSATFPIDDPATGEVIAECADGRREDALAALTAAETAFTSWVETSPRERSELLHRAFELMCERTDELVALICAENGKPESDARAEVTYAAEFFRWFAEEAVRSDGRYGVAPNGGVRTIVTQRAVGVAALVTPWNFPAAMVTRKIAPALAAGCTVVLKPAAETPLTALALARILREAGVPDGVVNVVPTTDPEEVVSAWLEDPRTRKISFTGSTRVGQHLLRQAASRVVNASMELGGNAPFVVAHDADVDAAVAGAVIAKFRGGGQACTAANRLYVHENVANEFVTLLSRRVKELRVGTAKDPRAQVGPLISARAVANMDRLVDDALHRGASIAAEAEVPRGLAGHFRAPAVLIDVPNDADVVQEEIFGPIAPIVTWWDEHELLDMVNGTEMGLASYVFSRDLKWAMRLGERIDAGMVAINRGLVSDPSAPFGGVKQSGLGREGAREGLAEYQETQYLSVDWG